MMNKAQLAKMLPAAVAVAGMLVILVWFFGGHGTEVKERLPGMDRSGEEFTGGVAAAKWEGKLVKGDGAPANLNGVWPAFRGPKGDNICTDPTPLAKSWPEGGLKALWRIPVGEGYAAPAIWKGCVFLMDYDTQAKADALRCLSLADGKEIWRYTYPVKIKRNHGMSRTIPTVTDKCVVAIGPKCHVICVDTLTGELRWKLDLVREFNTEVPPWYAGQCPLVDGDRVILGTGGDALVIAVDLMTGKLLWKSPNPRRWQMTHSSLTPVEFKGRRMYVYCASGGVAGVSATDGAILWSTPDWKIT
ncbi:MAG: polyvinylalcohol dehydrogenase, partial [Verrucomicrobia bacterium]|nr:polyvinylalcohol dehydrogenase [Verrucomicrobiota bacterium]